MSAPLAPIHPGGAGRSIEVDFFRGLVLLMILVDHIGGSIVSRVTLHAFAVCDAAEVFVFLGGYATASAFLAISARQGPGAASLRFVRRAAQIYRAFLATSTLMLVVSAVLDHYGIDSPNLALDDISVMLASPLTGLVEVLTFKRQPYLAAVLPMYVLFALSAPIIVPLAQRRPWALVAGSVAMWATSGWLASALLDTDSFRWSFNPFAWQMMFTAGVLARCQPFHRHIAAGRYGPLVTALALALIVCGAYYKVFSGLPLPEGEFKRNLGALRVLNFAAVAWLMAEFVRYGWIARVARALTPVVAIGRRGLLCFVVGAAISLTFDALMRGKVGSLMPPGSPREFAIGIGMAVDALALGSLMLVAGSAACVGRWRDAVLRRRLRA